MSTFMWCLVTAIVAGFIGFNAGIVWVAYKLTQRSRRIAEIVMQQAVDVIKDSEKFREDLDEMGYEFDDTSFKWPPYSKN
jgi:hypothetical protein